MPVQGEQGIFKALYQWGRVKEDFYSNSLVYILKQLRRDEKGKRIATEFINFLFNGKLSLSSDEWDIKDHTGNSTRPDIEVESDKYLVYIEVKVQSRVDYNQLIISMKWAKFHPTYYSLYIYRHTSRDRYLRNQVGMLS